MKDLIERLEKATGPDRESDFLIFEAILFPTEFFGSKIESWSRAGGAGYTVNTADGMRHLSAFNAPHYTRSIDAALTLVPEGPTWQVTGRVKEDGDYFADVNVDHRCDSAPTPALALCIAALKARGEPQ